ncbi:MAG: flippase [Ruminococcus sp.]|nr:flippase [Ruminococcus sp.]
MAKKSNIKKNFMYQMIYEVLVLILPFFTSPYIARVIGAEGLGIFSYSNSVAYYFVLLSMLGLKNHGNRAIASCRDHEYMLNYTFSNLLTLHVAVSLICSLAYIGYACTLQEGRLYAFIQIFYVLSAIFDISWFYFGIEKFKTTVTRNVIIRLLNVFCVFAFVHDMDDLWKYCLIMAIGTFISQLSLWIPLHKYVRIIKPEWKGIREHIKPMFILFIPAIAVSLYKYMDKIMIGILSDKTELGYYENAEKVVNIPMTIISSFGTVMLPKMSNLSAKSDSRTSRYYMGISMKYVMWLAFALSFGLCGVGTVFAPMFWGKTFTESGILIMMLSATIPFMSFANVIRTQYLIPNQRDKEYVSSVVCGAIINLIINTLLISTMGARGASIGTVAAEVSVCLVQTFVVRKQLPLLSYIKSFRVFILLGAVMFTAVYPFSFFMKKDLITLLVQLLVGILIYVSVSAVYLYKTKDEVFNKMLFQIKGKLCKNGK